MLITLNGVDARLYASQGQQRSVVLSLKIAELLILTEISGEKPILLLDDVMSELDQSRRSRLIEVISDHQVFMTCTEAESLGDMDALMGAKVHYYSVHNARVHKVEAPNPG
jgi:DNA replication and repair protein RecF